MATVAQNRDIQQAALGCWGTPADTGERYSRPVIDEFEDLYLTYRSRVWALCLRMTGNPDDAEDLTQETFIRIFQKLDTFRGESAFCTWLRRIAINVVLLRFQKASWRLEKSIEDLTDINPLTGCPHKMEFGRADTQLTEAVNRIALQRALNQLPPGFRTVLILHDIQGYEHVEISELMGCSVGTSKSQLHKARLKMRELLAQVPSEEPPAQRPEVAVVSRASDKKLPVVLQFRHTSPQRFSSSASEAA
jgi:RNA polymerase sigma-70 factor, ECF subfamily